MEVNIKKKKDNNYVIVMGNWNAVVGECKEDKIVDK